MENFLIYRILNLKTRKFYIGRTTTSIKNRWSIHLAHAKYGDEYSKKQNKKIGQTYLYKSMRKYGIENFEIKQIDQATSYDHMVCLENFYIKYYNSLDPKYGYNLVTDEYDSGHKRIISEETRKQISFNGHYKNNLPSGVGFDKNRNKFYLKMKFMCKNICVKRFKTEEEAKIAHDKLELFYYSDNPLLFFPEKKEQFLSEDLESFSKEMKKKRIIDAEFHGVKTTNKWATVKIGIGSGKSQYLGAYKTEKEGAIIWDKVASYFGYKKEDLNFPELYNESYIKEGKKIYKIYSNPNKQVQCVGGKSSKYNGVNKRTSHTWEMTLGGAKNRIREIYEKEIEAARAHDFYRRKWNVGLNKLNFPNEIINEKPQNILPNTKSHSLKQIKCISTGEIFDSIKNAAAKYNIKDYKFYELSPLRAFEINNLQWEIIN